MMSDQRSRHSISFPQDRALAFVGYIGCTARQSGHLLKLRKWFRISIRGHDLIDRDLLFTPENLEYRSANTRNIPQYLENRLPRTLGILGFCGVLTRQTGTQSMLGKVHTVDTP